MKKIILASAGIIFSIMLACAKTDTGASATMHKTDSVSFRTTPKKVEDPSKDMIKIPSNEVPFSLRSTLQGSEYSGWETNGVVYQNPGTGEYAVQINSVNSSSVATIPVWHRFDPNGKRIPDQKN